MSRFPGRRDSSEMNPLFSMDTTAIVPIEYYRDIHHVELADISNAICLPFYKYAGMLTLLRHLYGITRVFLYSWGASVQFLMLIRYLDWIPSSYAGTVQAYIRTGLTGLAGAGYIMSMIWLTILLGFGIYLILPCNEVRYLAFIDSAGMTYGVGH
ncbi:hypothetical protein BDZ89DRAFT_579682 [Hymenopellis radicata]|nr:hypothetical protein BDZ89DRAFT_579682 [Hymenopellis radicata]